jgi:hypothetical protein
MKLHTRIALLIAALFLVAPIGCDKKQEESDEAAAEQTEGSAEEGAEGEAGDEEAAAEEQAADDSAAEDEEASANAQQEQAGEEEEGNPFGITSTVELVEQGSQPRQQLRYKLDEIEEAIVRFTMVTSSKMTAGPQQQREVELPKMTLDIAMTNPTMQDDGNLRVEFELLGIAYEPSGDGQQAQMMARMMEQQLGDFEYSGHYIINERGQVLDGDINMDDSNPQVAQMSQNIEQSLQQVTTAFPEEAVGVGAKWKVNQNLGEALPFELKQNVVFEVLEIGGDKVTLKTTIDQSADAQTVEDASMPEGTNLELEEFTTQGSGEITFSLASLTPVGDLTIDMTMAMKGNMPQQGEQSMRTEMHMEMTMDEAPEDVTMNSGSEEEAPAQEAAE